MTHLAKRHSSRSGTTDTLTVEAGGRSVEVSRPDKILFPDAAITKSDLARYYARIARVMLPAVEGRPITMERYPDGIDEEGFYHKDAPDHFPDWVRRVTVETKGDPVDHVVADDAATLVYLADQGCITPHVWLSRADRIRHPDRMVFDLDPPEGEVGAVREAARVMRGVLEDADMAPRVMTSGSKGFHLHVTLDRSRPFDEVHDLARQLAERAADTAPDLLTVHQRKAKRGDRVFVDWLRNSYGQTAVAPYAVRARPGAPIATPIDWGELATTEPRSFTIANIFRRLGQKDDPWS